MNLINDFIPVHSSHNRNYTSFFLTESNVTVNTGNDYVYHYVHDLGVDVTGHSAISFDVMACNDAHVALSKDKGVDSKDTYEIVIGGWADSASVIRDCKQCHNYDVENHNHHPVSCTGFKSFWVSWAHSVIRVGTGKIVGKEIFMQWNDQGPHDVNYVAVATGWGATGKWVFHTANYFPGLFWIGASDMAVEGEWLWLPGATRTDYTNWAPGEPDNFKNQDHCAVIDAHKNYQWEDDNCVEKRNFICEYNPQDQKGVIIN
ncbi:hypothetical protein FSP39_008539 [Pinctada imbricata]|uniref:C-type lectin domain-containing protein n=1 Tax=Pinctada imbricata TaxID=66713 RepID=A0AA88XZT1_PINIB|nr:hypothetical protein FSP39_008539 [Pinctada imbricata]